MNAYKITKELNARLDTTVELTLYGRAAIQLGFPDPPAETLLSLDVDAVFWMDQAEQLNEKTNFWEAVEQVNQLFAEDGLYISHFFDEDMVILRSCWKEKRVSIEMQFDKLLLYRLSDVDLLLTKLMRDDPQDQEDARFIIKAAHLSKNDVIHAMNEACIPNIPELNEQFELASKRLLKQL